MLPPGREDLAGGPVRPVEGAWLLGFGCSSLGEGREDSVEPFSPPVWKKAEGGPQKESRKQKHDKKGIITKQSHNVISLKHFLSLLHLHSRTF